MKQPIPSAYKPWLIASLTVLVLSLVLLAADVTAAFIYFSRNATPFWVTVVGAASLLGIGVGFAGFFALMLVAGWGAFRESRRVQVLRPDRAVGPAKD